MKYKLLFPFLLLLTTTGLSAQQVDNRNLRVVDTLTPQERNNRNRVILHSELDSLITLYNVSHTQPVVTQPVKEEKTETPWIVFIAMGVGLLIIASLLYLLFHHQKRSAKVINDLNRHIRGLEFAQLSTPASGSRGKGSQHLEKKITEMHSEVERLQEKNQQAMKQYDQVKREYELVKQRITEVYKMKNYPGYDPSKETTELVNGLLDTERSVAAYAYERFLKPVLAIADANKNIPGKINKEESEKLLQLLVSLSLLYIEYLYLRINDLSIGGKMVQRIQGLSKGNGLDPALLKQLNTEHGSRALVLRMVLDAMHIQQLSYPVFDETNLNLS